eukprot:s1453_g5.t1
MALTTPKSASLASATVKAAPTAAPVGLVQPGLVKAGTQLSLQPPAERVKALEAALEAEPYDLGAWDARLREAIQEGKAEPVFERAVKQLPFAARIWAAYAEWCEMQDSAMALGVYSRCLQQVPNMDLWLSYLNFSKRHQTLEEVLRSYGRAIDLLGSDWRAAPVWSDYLALLKHAYNLKQKKENPDAELQGKLLAEDPNPIDTAKRTLKKELQKVQDFHAQLFAPFSLAFTRHFSGDWPLELPISSPATVGSRGPWRDAMDDTTWQQLLRSCAEELGDDMTEPPESFELCVLAKVAAKRFNLPKRTLESQLLGSHSLHQSRALLQQALPLPSSELQQLLRKASRSRSRRLSRARQLLQQLGPEHCRSPWGAPFCRQLRAAAADRAAEAAEPAEELPERLTGLQAPVTLGPPAFFPVGNAAGRFAALTAGLAASSGDVALLFVGLSDPRHLFEALLRRQAVKGWRCAMNDLNAETCARNALILQLLNDSSASLSRRIWTIFALWWFHELPLQALPLLRAAAAAAKPKCCSATRAMLEMWSEQWQAATGEQAFEGSEMEEVLRSVQLDSMPPAFSEILGTPKTSWLKQPVTCNVTLRHSSARLQYQLHRGLNAKGDAWQLCSDGVLLWPEEMLEPEGLATREAYLGALAKLFPPFAAKLLELHQQLGEICSLEWSCVAGDCLATGPFQRIFTSNVADHVGLPGLVLALAPLLCPGGKLSCSLNNNLKALDFNGDVVSLVPKLHGIDLQTFAQHMGVTCEKVEGVQDQLWITRTPLEMTPADSDALASWILHSASQLHRCPAPDPETLRRRAAEGEALGMAQRFARRFTCSKVTVCVLAALLRRLDVEVATELLRQLKVVAPSAMMRLAQCLPDLHPLRTWALVRFQLPSADLPRWAWQSHPTVLLLWLRPEAFAAATATLLRRQEPKWHRCNKPKQLKSGVAHWDLELAVEDGFDLKLLDSGDLEVTFALDSSEVAFGVGGAAFLLSVVDNVIVSGPHEPKAEEFGRAGADISDSEFLRVTEILKIDTEFVRKVFQRCAGASHSTMDKLWLGYEQFEKSQGNPAMAAKYMSEHMPRYVRGKAAYKELSQLGNNMDFYAVAVPITPKTQLEQKKLFDQWRAILRFERTNPLQLEGEELTARVALVYQQASLACGFSPDLWYDFSAWLDLGGKQEEATEVLRKAVQRFLPKDLTLRLLLAQRYELGESPLPTAQLEAADEAYRKLMEDMPKPCPLALINFLGYVRRQRGANDFRDSFLEASESSPHCTWEVYVFAAMTEYHVYGAMEAAAGVFRLGLERYGDREPSMLAAYVNFLIGCNDLRSARAELTQGVLEKLQQAVRDKLANREESRAMRESLAFLWQKWARLENYFGDAEAVRRATSFRDSEYRNLQRDLEVDEENILQTPISLGLSTSIQEVEESFRFLHLLPRSKPELIPAPFVPMEDQAVADAETENARLTQAAGGLRLGLLSQVARPDTSKMLVFKPALDVVSSRKRQVEGLPPDQKGQEAQLPVMIPKCLQDLLAVLPSRPMKGAKPDVDYLLTVLQTVSIPPVPVKELDTFRYDSLRLLKSEEDRVFMKDDLDEDGEGFFSARATHYRERLQAKRQKVLVEQHTKQES